MSMTETAPASIVKTEPVPIKDDEPEEVEDDEEEGDCDGDNGGKGGSGGEGSEAITKEPKSPKADTGGMVNGQTTPEQSDATASIKKQLIKNEAADKSPTKENNSSSVVIDELGITVSGRQTRSKSRKEEQLLMKLCGAEAELDVIETSAPSKESNSRRSSIGGGSNKAATPIQRQLRTRSTEQKGGGGTPQQQQQSETNSPKFVVGGSGGGGVGSNIRRNSRGFEKTDLNSNGEIHSNDKDMSITRRTLSAGIGNMSSHNASGGGGASSNSPSANKPQTIIVTETRSLAKVINDAVRKDNNGQSDGKPTLVIIETKSGGGVTVSGASSSSSSSNVNVISSQNVRVSSVSSQQQQHHHHQQQQHHYSPQQSLLVNNNSVAAAAAAAKLKAQTAMENARMGIYGNPKVVTQAMIKQQQQHRQQYQTAQSHVQQMTLSQYQQQQQLHHHHQTLAGRAGLPSLVTLPAPSFPLPKQIPPALFFKNKDKDKDKDDKDKEKGAEDEKPDKDKSKDDDEDSSDKDKDGKDSKDDDSKDSSATTKDKKDADKAEKENNSKSEKEKETVAAAAAKSEKEKDKDKDSTAKSKDDVEDSSEVTIDIPSLVVPFLIEYPVKEKLSQYIKTTFPPEVIGAAEEAPKKKKKRKADSDEEWAGDDEEEDDDEDDDVVVEDDKTKKADDKAGAPATVPGTKPSGFESSLGKFFIDIGLNLVQERVQLELYKSQKRKLDKGWKSSDREKMVKSLTKNLEDYKKKNGVFQHSLQKCPMPSCTFKTESLTVLEHHMEALHLYEGKFMCAFCSLTTQEPTEILRHLYDKHRVYGRLEKRLLTHACPLCPFEDSSKARLTRHSWKCQKTFEPDRNQDPPPDFEPPAKRIRLVAPVSSLTAAAVAGASLTFSGVKGIAGLNLKGATNVQPPPLRPKPDMNAYSNFASGKGQGNTTFVPAGIKGPYLTGSAAGGTVLPRNPQTSISSQNYSQGGPILMSGALQNSTYQIQQGQLYQVVNANSPGGVVPVVGGGAYRQLGAPGFTILPTATTSTVSSRGPTPVALIPNVARSLITPTGVSVASQLASARSAGRQSGPGISSMQQSLSSKPNISITPVMTRNVSSGGSTLSLNNSSSQLSVAKITSQGPPNSRVSSSSIGGGGQGGGMAGRAGATQGGGGAGGQPKFVVCEICDGYIKDLDQLRNHMQWIHKVKIHPKMIHNRPPLNCQKCQFRFFTDQGLERHLLGSHGLVTSSMQESANKGKDGGRCTVCGRVFVWKLLVHMAKDHKMVLKPAHLSYKCTVCSATFNMYRLFENHVYEAHSTVAKRVLDKPSGVASGGGVGSGSLGSRGGSDLHITSSSSVSISPVTVGPMKTGRCSDCGAPFVPEQCDHPWRKKNQICRSKMCRSTRCEKCRKINSGNLGGHTLVSGGAGTTATSSLRKGRAGFRGRNNASDDDVEAIEGEVIDDDEEEEDDDIYEDSDDTEFVTVAKPSSDGAGRELRSLRSKSGSSSSLIESPMKRSGGVGGSGGGVSVTSTPILLLNATNRDSSGSSSTMVDLKKDLLLQSTTAAKPQTKPQQQLPADIVPERRKVELVFEKSSENNDNDDEDAMFDMEVETHDHTDQEEEIHTDVDED